MSQLEKELGVAVEAAREAGVITEKLFSSAGQTEGVTEKSKGHPVTEADIDADRAIKKIIRETFPEDGWLSEETADTQERLSRDRVWIVDPIDGTKEFIKGLPEYVISIALAIDGRAKLGVVFQPTTGVLFTALDGQGAFRNELPLAIRQPPVQRPRILVSRSESRSGLWDNYSTVFSLEPFGSIAHKLCRVAAGEADGTVTFNPRSEWDIAAGVAILTEAGGKVTNHAGETFIFNRPNPVSQTGIIGGAESFVTRVSETIWGDAPA